MSKIQHEIIQLTRDYVRGGGKTNRRQQLKRMLAFGIFAEQMGAKRLENVGGRHVIHYYKAHRHFSNTTLLNHYYAIKTLFSLSRKSVPPKPIERV